MNNNEYYWINQHPVFEWWPGRLVGQEENNLLVEDPNKTIFKI